MCQEGHKNIPDWASNKKLGCTISKFLNQDRYACLEESKRRLVTFDCWTVEIYKTAVKYLVMIEISD